MDYVVIRNSAISRSLYWLVGGLAWLGALWGVLQLHNVQGLFGHAICGPWGCGPPVEALLSYHGFWAVLLWPVAGLIAAAVSPRFGVIFGRVLTAVGSAIVLLLVANAAFQWIQTAGTSWPSHILPRTLFVVATTVDIPAIQMAIAGVVCSQVSRLTHSRCNEVGGS